MKVILSTLGFVITGFVSAALWRVGIFANQYATFNYADSAEPTVAAVTAAVTSLFIVGFFLSVFFGHVQGMLKEGALLTPMRFAITMGIVYYATYILAFIPRHDVSNIAQYLGLEAVLILLQFVVFGLILTKLYKRS